jgi:hypothetical protein
MDVNETDVSALIARGYLPEDSREDSKAIKGAIEGVISDLVLDLSWSRKRL